MPIFAPSPTPQGQGFPFGEAVHVIRAGVSTDPYSGSSTADDWDNPAAEFDVAGCAVANGGSTEIAQTDRQSVEADYDVFMPAGTDITAYDRLVVRGETCEVVGRPFEWRHPMTGWTPGVFVQAKVVLG